MAKRSSSLISQSTTKKRKVTWDIDVDDDRDDFKLLESSESENSNASTGTAMNIDTNNSNSNKKGGTFVSFSCLYYNNGFESNYDYEIVTVSNCQLRQSHVAVHIVTILIITFISMLILQPSWCCCD